MGWIKHEPWIPFAVARRFFSAAVMQVRFVAAWKSRHRVKQFSYFGIQNRTD